MSAAVQVLVRVRPFNPKENDDGHARPTVSMTDDAAYIYDPSHDNKERDSFRYDKCFWSLEAGQCPKRRRPSFASQEYVYSYIGPRMLEAMWDGYNTCLFAYGQTGSGKTHTMMGDITSQAHRGIIPRFVTEMFDRIKREQSEQPCLSFRVVASYHEIYNEKVKDLLAKDVSVLRVRQHPVEGPFVEGLSSHQINDTKGIYQLLRRGDNERSTARTQLNDRSSRSHAIFTLTVTRVQMVQEDGSKTVQTRSRVCKVNLVDLAGSERVAQSGVQGGEFVEAKKINLSLATLGRVIDCLVERSEKQSSKNLILPPYRESVLTWLLSDSLGGNSKTFMLATISPSPTNFNETLSTLRYSAKARNIINKATVNEEEESGKLVAELREKVRNLQTRIRDAAEREVKMKEALEERCAAAEAEVDTLRNSLAIVERKLGHKIKIHEEEERLAKQLKEEKAKARRFEKQLKKLEQQLEVEQFNFTQEREDLTQQIKNGKANSKRALKELEQELRLKAEQQEKLAGEKDMLFEQLQKTRADRRVEADAKAAEKAQSHRINALRKIAREQEEEKDQAEATSKALSEDNARLVAELCETRTALKKEAHACQLLEQDRQNITRKFGAQIDRMTKELEETKKRCDVAEQDEAEQQADSDAKDERVKHLLAELSTYAMEASQLREELQRHKATSGLASPVREGKGAGAPGPLRGLPGLAAVSTDSQSQSHPSPTEGSSSRISMDESHYEAQLEELAQERGRLQKDARKHGEALDAALRRAAAAEERVQTAEALADDATRTLRTTQESFARELSETGVEKAALEKRVEKLEAYRLKVEALEAELVGKQRAHDAAQEEMASIRRSLDVQGEAYEALQVEFAHLSSQECAMASLISERDDAQHARASTLEAMESLTSRHRAEAAAAAARAKADVDAKAAEIQQGRARVAALETSQACLQEEISTLREKADATTAALAASHATERELKDALASLRAGHAEELATLQGRHEAALADAASAARAAHAEALQALRADHAAASASASEAYAADLNAATAAVTKLAAAHDEALRDAEATHEARLVAVQGAHEEEVARVREDAAAQLAAARAAHEEESAQLREKHEADLTTARAQHAEQLSVLRESLTENSAAEQESVSAAHAAVVSTLEASHQAEVEALRTAQAEEAARVEASWEERLSTLTAAHAADAALMREEHAQVRESLEASLVSLREQHSLQIKSAEEALRVKHEAHVESIRGEHERHVKHLEETLRASHDAHVVSLREDHEVSVKDAEEKLCVSHEARIVSLREEHQVNVKKIEETLRTEHEERMVSLRQEHEVNMKDAEEKLLAAQTADVDRVERRREEEVVSLRTAHEREVASLHQEHESHINTVEEALRVTHESHTASLRQEHEVSVKTMEETLRTTHEEKLVSLRAEHEEHVKAAEEKLRAIHEAHVVSLREEQERHVTHISETLRAEHAVRVKTAEQTLRLKLEKSERVMAGEMSCVREQHAGEVEALHKTSAEQVALVKALREEMRVLAAAHAAEVQELRAAGVEARASHDEEVAALRSSLEQRLAALGAAHREEGAALKERHAAALAAAAEELRAAKAGHDDEAARVRKKNAEVTAALKKRHQEMIERAKQAMRDDLQRGIEEGTAAFQKESRRRNAAEEDMRALNKLLREKVQDQEHVIGQLEEQLAAQSSLVQIKKIFEEQELGMKRLVVSQEAAERRALAVRSSLGEQQKEFREVASFKQQLRREIESEVANLNKVKTDTSKMLDEAADLSRRGSSAHSSPSPPSAPSSPLRHL
eukprot:TRINITY_DN5372_c0_g1_i7.p1 TRINITY_DN5372_c0_g1~~TRINITY_DN5372_c0_g1_i7.p1  ORF type:complete len:1787 (+),score=855.42 TRINITY_DN5372_c0_g1_i7:91-5451(+)